MTNNFMWSEGWPTWQTKHSKNKAWTCGDPQYAACVVEQRGNWFYVQYYGCDIHTERTLEAAKAYAEKYLDTPRNPDIAARYPRKEKQTKRGKWILV